MNSNKPDTNNLATTQRLSIQNLQSHTDSALKGHFDASCLASTSLCSSFSCPSTWWIHFAPHARDCMKGSLLYFFYTGHARASRAAPISRCGTPVRPTTTQVNVLPRIHCQSVVSLAAFPLQEMSASASGNGRGASGPCARAFITSRAAPPRVLTLLLTSRFFSPLEPRPPFPVRPRPCVCLFRAVHFCDNSLTGLWTHCAGVQLHSLLTSTDSSKLNTDVCLLPEAFSDELLQLGNSGCDGLMPSRFGNLISLLMQPKHYDAATRNV